MPDIKLALTLYERKRQMLDLKEITDRESPHREEKVYFSMSQMMTIRKALQHNIKFPRQSPNVEIDAIMQEIVN